MMMWSRKWMRMMLQARCSVLVSSLSAALGRRLPDGWLWQTAMIVALANTASRIMIRMSTATSVMPPCEMRTFLISR